MNFLCECGHRISDTTDYISYKAHLISDQDWFDFLDAIDSAIEKSGPTKKDKEVALMQIRSLAIKLDKSVYQCKKCGNLFFDNKSGHFEMFQGSSEDVNKELLQSAKGEEWQGFLYGEWVDKKPDWLVSNGYICADTLIKGKQYDDWETLEKDYYTIFNELKLKNVLRSSSLKKNKKEIHSWCLSDEGENSER